MLDYSVNIPKYTNTWIINLSLTERNVLVSSVIKYNEVLENKELYLELLKKFDNTNYYDYIDAFNGEISFEEADKYYKFDYEQTKKDEDSEEIYKEKILDTFEPLKLKKKKF